MRVSQSGLGGGPQAFRAAGDARSGSKVFSSMRSQQTTADSRPEETIGCGQPQLKCVGPTGPMIGLREGFI